MFRSAALTLTLCLAAITAQATLVSRAGGQAYYDTDTDLTWVADANLAVTSGYCAVAGNCINGSVMDWWSAQAWIGSLNTANYLGLNDWRLPITVQPDPSCSFNAGGDSLGYNCLGSEMPFLYAEGITPWSPGPFSNVQGLYWSVTEFAGFTPYAWYFGFVDNYQNANSKVYFFSAWAVRGGDIALDAVPVPGAAWLFGSALCLMPAIRRKVVEKRDV